MTISIKLTLAGTDVGPFSLYSNVTYPSVPFETGVSRAALLAGYVTSNAPNGTTVVKVQSTGNCTNYVNVPQAL